MTTLTLADTRIRQDAHGRYCLNDLHKAAVAAGANKRTTEPNKFFRSTGTTELVALLVEQQTTPNSGSFPAESATPIWGSTFAPVNAIDNGPYEERGTFVCIELVTAYAMYVSPAFHLKVIRTFLATMHGEHAMPHIQSAKFWDALRPHWVHIARLALAGFKNVQIAQQVDRSVGSVGRCLRRMFDVGYLNPVQVFKARLNPATAARWAIEKPVAAQWGRIVGNATPAPQTAFNFEFSGATA